MSSLNLRSRRTISSNWSMPSAARFDGDQHIGELEPRLEIVLVRLDRGGERRFALAFLLHLREPHLRLELQHARILQDVRVLQRIEQPLRIFRIALGKQQFRSIHTHPLVVRVELGGFRKELQRTFHGLPWPPAAAPRGATPPPGSG